MKMTPEEMLCAANPDRLPSPDDVARLMPSLLGQIRWARQYTLQLLDATPMEMWYVTPPGHISHIAWQVGHLAVSQYGLLMFRVRGRQPGDLDLIPSRFRKTFGRGGSPPESAAGQPTADDLLAKLDEVHRLSMATAESTDVSVWLEPIEMPYAVYPCKLGAALFQPMHENLHAGQIGLIRRALGLESVR